MNSKKEASLGIRFILVFTVGFLSFYIIPFFISIFMTFIDNSSGKLCGFDNYIKIMGSKAFKLSAVNTFKFLVIGVPLILALSLFCSLLLKNNFKGSGIIRSIFILPIVIPAMAVVMVFQIIFAESGLLNSLLITFNIPVISWLNSDKAFVVLLVIYVWKNIGYNMILFLSALNSIPDYVYEAAALDGAGRFKKLTKITLPLISPMLFFIIIISVVNAFKSFREIYLLCGDLPHESIYMLQHFMNNNFKNLNYQRLAVAAVLLFSVIMLLILTAMTYNNHMKKKLGE